MSKKYNDLTNVLNNNRSPEDEGPGSGGSPEPDKSDKDSPPDLLTRGAAPLEQFSVYVDPLDKQIIKSLASYAHKSQREVLEILIDSYIDGKQEKVKEIIKRVENKKDKGLLE